uniref:Protein kinase domain-containing protein n=1 Tax=Arcella intermedia TaxID=1963864 RepID=A0A6B2L098_9EUKA
MTLLIESINSLISVFHGNKRSVIKTFVPYSLPEKNINGDFEFSHLITATLKGNTELEVPEAPGNFLPLKLLAPDIAEIQQISLEKVEREKKLGEGAFGVVYKGTWTANDQTIAVAIKELKINDVGEEELNQFVDFVHEINLMREFDSPHLIKLFGTTLNPLSMVMEFCPSKSLDVILYDKETYPDERLPWNLRLKISLDIATGLHILHTHKPPLMHRDLRSPNIFINTLDLSPGVVNAKIGDFGLSQLALPTLNELLACWQWLGPEVFDSESTAYNEKSDVYSLGIVMSEIASRVLPFSQYKEYLDIETISLPEEQLSDDSVIETLRNSGYNIVGNSATKEVYKVQLIKNAIITENLRPTLPTDCPVIFADVIEDCWHKNPFERISLEDCIEDLKILYLSHEAMDEPSLLSPRFKSTRSALRLPSNTKEQLQLLIEPTVPIEQTVAALKQTEMIIHSIACVNLNIPAENKRARGVFVRLKYHQRMLKTVTSKNKKNTLWLFTEPWKVTSLLFSAIPIEVGISMPFSSALIGRGVISPYKILRDYPQTAIGAQVEHEVVVHKLKKNTEFPDSELGKIQIRLTIKELAS